MTRSGPNNNQWCLPGDEGEGAEGTYEVEVLTPSPGPVERLRNKIEANKRQTLIERKMTKQTMNR